MSQAQAQTHDTGWRMKQSVPVRVGLVEARRYLADASWLVIFPTAGIMTCVLSINFVGGWGQGRSRPSIAGLTVRITSSGV